MIGIQIPAVQTQVAKYAVKELNKSFGTEINVEKVAIDLFGDVNLYGVSSKDNHQIEFISIDQVNAKLSLTGIIKNPNRITLKKVTLYNPDVKVITYKGEELSNFLDMIAKFSNEDKKEKSDFRIKGAVEIINGKLRIENQNLEENKQVWIDARNLNSLIENFKFENDEVWADLRRMEFNALRQGEEYTVKNLSTDFHYSQNELRFDGLNFESNDSYLDGHLVLSYDEAEGMADFANKVQWDLNLKDGTKVNLKDIRYFVPNFDKNTTVNLTGTATGTLNNLQLNDFQLDGNGALIAAKEFVLLDMTEGAKILLRSNDLKARTSYADLVNILPTFIGNKIPNYINRFGTMDYRGDFLLDPTQIKIDGNAITALGDADLNVLLSDYRSKLKYSGKVKADELNIRQIADVPELGMVTGEVAFQGEGTDLKTLQVSATGNLAYLDLVGNRYHNIELDGTLNKQKFEGLVSIVDPQLNANYDGVFDFSRKPYQLKFSSQVRNINLDYLGITKNLNAHLRSEIDGDFSFSTIDDFVGKINLHDLYFTSKTDTLSIANAQVFSSKSENNQRLELDVPGYLKGEINGKFRLSQLPNAITNAVGTTALLTYKQKHVDPGQKFNFYFEVEQDLFGLIEPRIQIAPGSIVDATVETDTNHLVAELTSKEMGFDGFTVYSPLINIDTSKELEQIYLRSDSVEAKGVMAYNLSLHSTPTADAIKVNTNFQIGKEFPIDFDLNLYQTLDEQKNLVLGFASSTIDIDDTRWYLNPQNDLTTNRAILNLNKDYYELQKLLLESEGQKLLLDGYYSSRTDYKLNADLEELILSKIIPKGLLGKLEIDGVANGKVDIIRSKEEFKPWAELKIDSVALNKYYLGDLGINGVYNVQENVFDLELFLEQDQVQVLYANGFINNKTETPEINMAASLDDLNFKFLESFLSAAMSNVRGVASGNVRFTGPIDSPNFDGTLDLTNLGFKVDYLNVDYSFDGVNTVPVHKESGGQGFITLDEVAFRDTRYNTKGEVSGQLLFRDVSSWFLNLSFNTGNLLVMDTNVTHNELFYGRVFGQGAFELFGPPEKLDISAKALINDGSVFTINTGATIVESENKLVRFIPEYDKEEGSGTPKGMNIDLDITATPTATVNLIIDPTTDDKVVANGYTENLKFKMSRTGMMTLDGEYTLESGEYQFRQVPLVNRDFNIQAGSFVHWGGGSAFDAEMNIVATYERTVSNVGEYLGVGFSQTYDVTLGIIISETLKKPKLDFTLTIPKAGSDVQSAVDYKFNINPDEKMIQFASILLLNQFNTDSQSVLATGATSTGIGIAFKQLGAILNSMIGGFNVNLDYVTGSSMSNTSDRFKGGINVNLSPRWTFNGAVGVPVGSRYSNETTTGEAEIQWDISKKMDKSLVVNFFTRPTNFGVENFGGSGNYQSYGAGIIYKTSFDRISELFKKDKTEKKTVPTTIPTEEEPLSEEQLPSEQQKVQPSSQEKTDSINENKSISKSTSVEKKSSNSLVRFK